MESIDLRTLTKEARAELKRVVLRRYKQQKNKSEIARELGIRREVVTDWVLGACPRTRSVAKITGTL